jgi:hypothetical protein
MLLGHKTPEWQKPFFGTRLLEKVVVKDFKDTINTLGLRTGIAIKDRFYSFGMVKKIRAYEVKVLKKRPRAKLFQRIQEDIKEQKLKDKLVKNPFRSKKKDNPKKGKRGRPPKSSKKEKPLKFKKTDYDSTVWYEFLIRDEGLIGAIKSFFGFGEKIVILMEKSFQITKGEVIINDNIKIEKLYGLYIVSCDEARELVEMVVWKIAHEEGLGNYMDFPRKLSYLTPMLPINVEKMERYGEMYGSKVPIVRQPDLEKSFEANR